jgi:putative nucleotidyltransferase with HDIG domain
MADTEIDFGLSVYLKGLDSQLKQDTSMLNLGNDVVGVFREFHSLRPAMFEHGARVGAMALKLGRFAGLTDEQCYVLALGGALHDLGKAADLFYLEEGSPEGIPEHELDFIRVEPHPILGMRVVADMNFPLEVVKAVRDHHTPFRDRQRYLKEGRPDYTGLVMIADIYDAITSERPGDPAKPQWYAVGQTKRLFNEGHLNPDHKDAFDRLIASRT